MKIYALYGCSDYLNQDWYLMGVYGSREAANLAWDLYDGRYKKGRVCYPMIVERILNNPAIDRDKTHRRLNRDGVIVS